MDVFPSPTVAYPSRTEVFVAYLDFFRSAIIARVERLATSDLRGSRLPTGWTPLELVKHLTFVEMRWLEWGFDGNDVAEPWGDNRDGKWFVAESESREDLIGTLRAQGFRSRNVIRAHALDEIGQPGPRWDGAEPATLERILFHLVQEYSRHLGHLDIVVELAGGPVGEES
ncbi:MAG: DUF664 domain-containing protein [Acidimicrobiales bacterium]